MAPPRTRPAGQLAWRMFRVGCGWWEEGGDERIGDRLERPVCVGENERAQYRMMSGRHLVLVGRAANVTNAESVWNVRGGEHQFGVAELVHDHPADDDAEAEPGETGAGDLLRARRR